MKRYPRRNREPRKPAPYVGPADVPYMSSADPRGVCRECLMPGCLVRFIPAEVCSGCQQPTVPLQWD